MEFLTYRCSAQKAGLASFYDMHVQADSADGNDSLSRENDVITMELLAWRGFTWKREDKKRNLFARDEEDLKVFSMFPK